MKDRKIRISMVDYWNKPPNDCYLFKILNNELRSRIELNTENPPDIVISFGFGQRFKMFDSQCIKIRTLFNEKWLYPDDNWFDYYIGSVNNSLQDSDKACYIPFWLGTWYGIKQHNVNLDKYLKKDFLNREFCSEVGRLYDRPHRKKFIEAIESQYKKVKVVDNSIYINRLLPNDSNNASLSKIDFISNFKFNLTFENGNKVGYITEKAVEPFFAGTVPVYFGNNQTFYNDFEYDDRLMLNGKTYQEVIDYMIYLDTHDDAYLDLIGKYFRIDKIDEIANKYVANFSRFLERVMDSV